MTNSNTSRETFHYDVVTEDNIRVRSGKVSGIFSIEIDLLEVDDILAAQAYAKEEAKSWKHGYEILES